jgi:hypothetical protein
MKASTKPHAIEDGPIDDGRKANFDRRASARIETFKGAEITWPNGVPVRCMVRNLSQSGANLEVYEPVLDTFDLVFDLDKKRHSCLVMWRKAPFMGVKFL